MLELNEAHAAVIACIAEAAALEALPSIPAACAVRVAPDELLLIGARDTRASLLEQARLHLEQADPGGLVVDQTDGWAAFTLRGEGTLQLFRRLSVLRPPAELPAFVQGGFAQSPAKLLFLADALHVLVPAPVGHHVRKRMLDVGAGLAIRATQPEPLDVGALAGVPA